MSWSPQPPIEIFGTPYSNYVRAVRMVLAEKDLGYIHLPVAPRAREAALVHPLGLVPALRHGEVVVAESIAIVGYLDALEPETPMGPSGPPAAAAEIAQWISIVATTVDPVLIRRYVVSYAFPKGPNGQPDRAAIDAALPDLRGVFAALETRLSGRDHLAVDRFTFADALLMSTLSPTLRRPEAAEISAKAPALRRYFERHAQRACFIDTSPP
jgi:glutathione S-transferase